MVSHMRDFTVYILLIFEEQLTAGQQTTNQSCHCHGYARFLQLENKGLETRCGDLILFQTNSIVL